MNFDILFYSICAVVLLIMIIYYLKRKHKFLSALFGSCSGLTALFLVNYFGGMLGTNLPINVFNLCGSIVLGAPFVAAMVVIRYI